MIRDSTSWAWKAENEEHNLKRHNENSGMTEYSGDKIIARELLVMKFVDIWWKSVLWCEFRLRLFGCSFLIMNIQLDSYIELRWRWLPSTTVISKTSNRTQVKQAQTSDSASWNQTSQSARQSNLEAPRYLPFRHKICVHPFFSLNRNILGSVAHPRFHSHKPSSHLAAAMLRNTHGYVEGVQSWVREGVPVPWYVSPVQMRI